MIRLKTKDQIAGIKVSCDLLSELLRALKPMVKPGATPRELDRFAHDFIVQSGGRPAFLGYEGYPSTLCVSVNEAVIHGIPDDRPFREGDIVGIDCGIDLHGHFSDAAVTWPVGAIRPELERLLSVTRECLDRAVAAVQPGARVHDISRAVFSLPPPRASGSCANTAGMASALTSTRIPRFPTTSRRVPIPASCPAWSWPLNR